MKANLRREWERIARGEVMPQLSERTRQRIRVALDRAAERDAAAALTEHVVRELRLLV